MTTASHRHLDRGGTWCKARTGRALSTKTGGKVQLRSRNDNDFNAPNPAVETSRKCVRPVFNPAGEKLAARIARFEQQWHGNQG